MENNYLIFTLGYDECKTFEAMELACDEAYRLAQEVVKRYEMNCDELQIEQYYDTFRSFVNTIDLSEVWKEIEYR